MTPLLLDTCAIIWTAEAALGPSKARAAMRDAYHSGQPVYVSPISAWEIGMLIGKRRLNIRENPVAWFRRLCAQDGVKLADLSVEMLMASGTLPDLDHGDPADRIIIATAREHGLRIVTRDRKILDYADKGHVMAMEC